MIKKFFVTGTDTNVGKTLSVCTIIRTLIDLFPNKRVIGYKPIATGCQFIRNKIYSEDAISILSCSNVMASFQDVNPISLYLPTSPNIASKKENIPIRINRLSMGLRNLESLSDFIIIEGIGGWLTPINEFNHTLEDWMIYEKDIPIILVVGIKLGCINHALLTVKSIQQSQIKLIGWIANRLSSTNSDRNLVNSLKDLIRVPMIGEIPWILEKKINPKSLIKYINLSFFVKILTHENFF